MYKSDTLKLNDSEMQYTVTGQGPGLVFVHGLGGSHLSWWQQIPFFSQHYTCIAYSQRGFATSKNLSNTIETSVFTDDLAALIDHLGMDRVFLVGQSMGGWSCLHYAMRDERRVRALVMASTTGALNFSLIDHPEIRNLPLWDARSNEIGKQLAQRGILKSVGARFADENPRLAYLYRQIYDQTPAEYREAVRKKIREQRTLLPDSVSQLDIPVFFVTGGEDLLFPPGAAAAAASIMPSATYRCVLDVGHSLHFERAQVFNALLAWTIHKLADAVGFRGTGH